MHSTTLEKSTNEEQLTFVKNKLQLDIVYAIEDYEKELRQASANAYGVSAWFRAYLLSDDYGKLNSENKGGAFDTYVTLHDFLSKLFDEASQADVEDVEILELFYAGLTQSHSEGLDHAHARTYGLSAWFKAYLLSDAYVKLNTEMKSEAIDTHTILCIFLAEINGNKFSRN